MVYSKNVYYILVSYSLFENLDLIKLFCIQTNKLYDKKPSFKKQTKKLL